MLLLCAHLSIGPHIKQWSDVMLCARWQSFCINSLWFPFHTLGPLEETLILFGMAS